ncbi:MAG TPA: MoxR family ATPase, partial [Burkholderiales bacterium]|nr:MoxR family ATPase [Burkholderiales bacterium]
MGEFDPTRVDPTAIPVTPIRLREGYGFARIQGSPEVFPDNLTGAINLAKLEQVGDPTSPLVFEPGKLLQANRGFLLIDEIGKLPRGTQNVLLQALQENIVTPAKSRETFPASFVAVTTSNLADLDNINEPLNDRLTNLYVGFPTTLEKNRAVIDYAIDGAMDGSTSPRSGPRVWIPTILRDASAHLIADWRRAAEGVFELDEVGSNRTMVEILRRAESYATLARRDHLTANDFRRGATDAMRGRIRARGGESFLANKETVDAFLEKHWKEAGKRAAVSWWCGLFVDELKQDRAEGERVIRETREVVGNPELLARAQGSEGHQKFRRFSDYVKNRERVTDTELPTRVSAAFGLLQDFGTFETTDWATELARR